MYYPEKKLVYKRQLFSVIYSSLSTSFRDILKYMILLYSQDLVTFPASNFFSQTSSQIRFLFAAENIILLMKIKIMVVMMIFDIALLNTFQLFNFFISATLDWVQYCLRIANRTLPKKFF